MNRQTIAPDAGTVYQKKADRYRFFAVLSLVFGALLLAAVLFASRAKLGAENFRYFYKFLRAENQVAENAFADVSWTADSESTFALYKGDIALMSRGTLTLYSQDSTTLLRMTEEDSAVMNADGAYLLTFLPGQKNVNVYHSFSRKLTLAAASTVGAVTSSPDGAIAVSAIKGSGSVLTVFARNSMTWFEKSEADSLAFDLAFSQSGKSLAVLSLTGSGGTYATTLRVFDAAKGTETFSASLAAEKPVAVGYLQNGTLYALTDHSLTFVRRGGETQTTVALSASPTFAVQSDTEVLIVSGANAFRYSEKGYLIKSYACAEKITQAAYCGDIVCFMTEKTLSVYPSGEESPKVYPGGALALLADESENRLFLCDTDGVRQINLE